MKLSYAFASTVLVLAAHGAQAQQSQKCPSNIRIANQCMTSGAAANGGAYTYNGRSGQQSVTAPVATSPRVTPQGTYVADPLTYTDPFANLPQQALTSGGDSPRVTQQFQTRIDSPRGTLPARAEPQR